MPYDLDVSIGTSIARPTDRNDPEYFVKEADKRMYEEKQSITNLPLDKFQ
ncbi:MAG: GGDEF domain-containing protein [bacterium LCO1.1]|uniref:GGDEF domain-containing protein n=1 Tax=Candidatus Weimeria bifida TaxID=2599074 RepID=A0A6N7IZY3_9FIRM|nr:GGDEF domain-containing protein [Candidatus Weimeria bifida]